MKKFFWIFTFTISIAFGQKKYVSAEIDNAFNGQIVTNISPFKVSANKASLSSVLGSNTYLQFEANVNLLAQIEASNPAILSLELPVTTKKNMVLKLVPIDIFGPGYKVMNDAGKTQNIKKGVFYKGIIEDDSSSLVSINIINGELSGFVANNLGNFTLGKLKDNLDYIFYNNKDLSNQQIFNCGNVDTLSKSMNLQSTQSLVSLPNVACRAVQIYIELDNAGFVSNGSNITTATNYVNTIIGQVATIFQNDGLNVQISELKIWTTPDPYISATNTFQALDIFSTNMGTSFNGDLAHLLSTRSLGGGVAYLDVLCQKGVGVSAELGTYITQLPNFSWNPYVVSHELGHNFGSPHTHNCGWPGGAIDNCGPTAGYPNEGTCPVAPAPLNGGTIMSYCHQTANGINFNNGFGPLPGNLIRSRAQQCFGSSVAPINLDIAYVYSTTALLTWKHDMGSNFIIEYKPENSTIWLSEDSLGKFVELKNLIPNTKYNWRVKTSCSLSTNSTFFTNTIPALSYCQPSYIGGCDSFFGGINDVVVGGINYNPNSGCENSSGYSFNFKNAQNLIQGNNYSLSIKLTGNRPSLTTLAFIDYNKNGSFEPSEQIFNSTINGTYNTTSTTWLSNFNVPNNVTSVYKTRMRVSFTIQYQPTGDCVANDQLGETEDFFVNIGNCFPSVSLTNPVDNIVSGNSLKLASINNGKINANNSITGIGTRATYRSKNIILNPGFKAESGTVFLAQSGGCN